jgi:DNA modification methylase
LEKTRLKPVDTIIERGDARNLKLEDESIDCVITSPPYLNKSEYTNIFRIEETLLGIPIVEKPYIGSGSGNFELYPDFPPIAKSYFSGMEKVLGEMYRVCRNNAKIAIVIGGGCFPDKVIECDLVLAEISQKAGFNLKNILVTRDSWCTRRRTIKVGKIRESVILLKK